MTVSQPFDSFLPECGVNLKIRYCKLCKREGKHKKEKKNGKSRQLETQKGYEKGNKIIVTSSSSENNIYVATKM